MDSGIQLTPRTVHALFAEEVRDLGGTIVNTLEHAGRLYARSILPRNLAVGPGDLIQGGVAVRFCLPELCVRPYVFRKVCSNGAIMARALEAWDVLHIGVRDPGEVSVELREAIRACAAPEVHQNAARLMRSSRHAATTPADLELMALTLATRLGAAQSERLAEAIMERFEEERDDSRFGLMNAVTSVARDTPDPELRWRIEELGGSLAGHLPVVNPPSDRLAQSRPPMAVSAR